MAGRDIYVATQSGVANIEGTMYRIKKDETRVREGHPLLTTGLFKLIDVHFDVEDTRQAPGSKRTGRQSAKKDDDAGTKSGEKVRVKGGQDDK